jgi:hypothetical protein
LRTGVFEAVLPRERLLGLLRWLTARPQAVGYGITDAPAELAAFFLSHPGFGQRTFRNDADDAKDEGRASRIGSQIAKTSRNGCRGLPPVADPSAW